MNEWHATPEIKAEFSKEPEHFPQDYLANYMLGFIASSERQYEVSNKYLEASVAVNPNWPEPWLYLGLNAYARRHEGRGDGVSQGGGIDWQRRGALELSDSPRVRRPRTHPGELGRTEESEMYMAKARALQNKVLEQSQQNVAEMALAEEPVRRQRSCPSARRTKPKPRPCYRRTAIRSLGSTLR